MKKQRGIVLVVAMFIMALIATMAYVMMSRLERDTHRTSLILRAMDAENNAQGSIAWAMDQLRTDVENKQQGRLIDTLPAESPELEVNGYQIKSTITDLQGRFNLNNVTKEDQQLAFNRLLMAVQPGMTTPKATQITRALVDWITTGSNAEEFQKYYLALPHPYRAAHRPMVDRSELRLVKGVTPALYQALEPYIVALPAGTLINVQTAPAPVLLTLSPSMTLPVAQTIVLLRDKTPFTTIDVFNQLDVVKNNQISAQSITNESKFFLVETIVSIENQQTVLYTQLERVSAQGKNSVMLLIRGQSKGVW